MHVEDSYEGAVRRLRRLGHAGIHVAPPPPDDNEERLRDLEELATLACDENEQLKRELDAARMEMDRLRLQVMTLQQMMANPQEEPSREKRGGGGGAAFLFFLLIAAAAAAALFVLRPWDRAKTAIVAATVDPLPPPPVVTAPPPVVTAPPPVVTPPPPVVAAPVVPAVTMPKVVAPPVVPKAAPPVAAKASKHHHASKHHAAAKHKHAAGAASKPASKPAISDTDDPLGGLHL